MSVRGIRCSVVVFSLLILGVLPGVAMATSNPVPFLNPLQPAAVAPGGAAFTLTVTGTGFVAGSTVDWNGSPRTTTFVNSSKLTASIYAADIVASGTATITVVSPGPGGGISNQQYLPIVDSTSQLFWTTRDVADNVPTTSPLAEGDFNNDGKLDLVGAVGGVVYVLLGNGDGTFQAARGSNGPSGLTITSINVVDVNGDGKLDLIVTGPKTSSVSFVATMLGNGDGTFQAPVESDFSGAHFPSRLVVADFNGDGYPDVAYATATGVQTLTGSADGTFHLGPNSTLNEIGLAVTGVGDFNGDGRLDIAVTVYDPFTTGLEFTGVMLGIGDGSFGPVALVPGTGTPFASAITAVVADFNGDGVLDIATGIETAGSTIQGTIQVSLGNGDGSFQSPLSVPNVVAVTTPILVGDFTGNGKLDLVTGGYTYEGAGDGTFPVSQGSSGLPALVLAGDFNGDGRMDIVNQATKTVGGTAQSSFGLFLQTPPQPDFTGIVPPFSSVLVPGGSTSLVVTVQPMNGFTGDVIVSISDLPNGVSVSYNPAVVHGGSGTSTITLTASNAVPLGFYTVTLSGNSGTITHATKTQLEVNDSVGDWTGYVVESTQNIHPGAMASYTIVAQPLNGFNGTIALTASGLPPGATANFTPSTITGGSGSVHFNVQTSATTPQPAVSNITVTGTNGILVHNIPVYLGVSTSTGDFSGNVTPGQATVPATGGIANYVISISPVNGGAGDVALTASGLPPGATATFTPPTIDAGNGNSTLQVTTGSGTPAGTYQVVITSTAAGVVHQTNVNLVVTP
ncbi:MAG TPA: FG-GAP-like repeat-containing protein [Candidatus Dormibacteraeota bacterium]|nr:FG-GAP-like repeat-containing protein [Candidatus Dormibacteraeota bacterium]